jgi:phage anti-repressor protein
MEEISMSGMVEVIQSIVEAEIRKIHLTELGMVTSIFSHAGESDKENYECNIQLKNRDLELRKVPVSSGEEVVYVPPYSKNSDLRRFAMELPSGVKITINDDLVGISAGGTTLSINRGGNVEVQSAKEVKIVAKEDMSIQAKNLSITTEEAFQVSVGTSTDISVTENMALAVGDKFNVDVGSDLKVTAGATGKITTGTDLEMKVGANGVLETQANLSIKSSAMGTLEAGGPLTIKGAVVQIN